MMAAVRFIQRCWPHLMASLLAMVLMCCILTAAEWLSLNWYRVQLFVEQMQR